MSKTGRNEPCPCGSGKKYKKCCLQKDQEQAAKEQKYINNPESEWLLDEKWEDEPADDFFKDDYEEDLEEDDYNVDNTDDEYSKKGFDEYPAISEEDEKKVDAWWEKYTKLKTSDAIMQHLNEFLVNNSNDVIINLGLEQEVLFELITMYIKEGKSDEIILYMMQFREKYPEVYFRSAGYYDSDIIAWLIGRRRTDEIKNYLNYFESYPINYVDKLYETIDLLLATNNNKFLGPFVDKIYKSLWYSDEVMGGYEIADIPFYEILSQHITKDYSTEDIKNVIEKLKNLELDFDDMFYQTDFWKNKLKSFYRQYEKWDENVPKKKRQGYEKIYDISENFKKYMHQEKKLDLVSANYYSKSFLNYYDHILNSNKKPRNLFYLPKNQIDNIVTQISKDYMWIDATKALSMLNTIYYFADYLFVCGNYNEEEKSEVQKSTTELFNTIFKSLIKQDIEAVAFEKFPLFG